MVLDIFEHGSALQVALPSRSRIAQPFFGGRPLRQRGAFEQPVAGFGRDLERGLSGCSGLAVLPLRRVNRTQLAVNPAHPDPVADFLADFQRAQMEALRFLRAAHFAQQVARVVQHHRLVAPVTDLAECPQRQFEVLLRLDQLAAVHAQVGLA